MNWRRIVSVELFIGYQGSFLLAVVVHLLNLEIIDHEKPAPCVRSFIWIIPDSISGAIFGGITRDCRLPELTELHYSQLYSTTFYHIF
jgi:hypothetical protein